MDGNRGKSSQQFNNLLQGPNMIGNASHHSRRRRRWKSCGKRPGRLNTTARFGLSDSGVSAAPNSPVESLFTIGQTRTSNAARTCFQPSWRHLSPSRSILQRRSPIAGVPLTSPAPGLPTRPCRDAASIPASTAPAGRMESLAQGARVPALPPTAALPRCLTQSGSKDRQKTQFAG